MSGYRRLLLFLNACRLRPEGADLPPALATQARALFAAFDAMDRDEVRDQCRALAHLSFPDAVPVPTFAKPAALPAALRVGRIAEAVDAQIAAEADAGGAEGVSGRV